MSETLATETMSFTPDRDQPVMDAQRAALEPVSIVRHLLKVAEFLARKLGEDARPHERQKHQEREVVYRERNDQVNPTEWS